MFQIVLNAWYFLCALMCTGLTLLLIRSFLQTLVSVAREVNAEEEVCKAQKPVVVRGGREGKRAA